jgi:hypothetical protein
MITESNFFNQYILNQDDSHDFIVVKRAGHSVEKYVAHTGMEAACVLHTWLGTQR